MAEFYFDTKKKKSEAFWCDRGAIKGKVNLSVLGTCKTYGKT